MVKYTLCTSFPPTNAQTTGMEYVVAIYTEVEGIVDSFHIPALACFTHFSNCLLDVGKRVEHMSVGVDLDRLHIFSFKPAQGFQP